jgi:hypothetical protein
MRTHSSVRTTIAPASRSSATTGRFAEDRGRLLGCPTANETPDQQNRRELGTAAG